MMFRCSMRPLSFGKSYFLLLVVTSTCFRTVKGNYQLASTGSLASTALDANCQQILYQNITCDETISLLGERVYHPGLNNAALTTSLCAASCETSLKTARRRVAEACAKTPELTPGYPVLSMVDAIYAGWNETCLKDPSTSSYCNGKSCSHGKYVLLFHLLTRKRYYRCVGSCGRYHRHAERATVFVLLRRKAEDNAAISFFCL